MSSEEEKIAVAQVGMLIQQTKELTGAVKEIAEGVSTLLQFQASQQEKNEATKEWKERVDRHQEKQDDKIDETREIATRAENQSLSNGRWINLGVALLTGCVLYIAQLVFDKIFG